MIGMVVKHLKGRDRNKYAVIIALTDDPQYVQVADGKKRKVGNPKRKNLRHLERQDADYTKLTKDLALDQSITNRKIRTIIQRWNEKHEIDEKQMKGE